MKSSVCEQDREQSRAAVRGRAIAIESAHVGGLCVCGRVWESVRECMCLCECVCVVVGLRLKLCESN